LLCIGKLGVHQVFKELFDLGRGISAGVAGYAVFCVSMGDTLQAKVVLCKQGLKIDCY